MLIRIGNQSAFSAPSIMGPFQYAAANGFDAFEWFPDKKESGAGWAEGDMSKEQRDFIKKTSLAHDIRLSVHAPWQANPLRPEAREIFTKDIELAQDIGACLLNIHLYTDEGIPSYVQAIIPLIEDLSKTGIKLSIENTPVTGPDDFNELFRQIQDSGLTETGHVGMCLDLGHANLCTATHNDYLKFVDLLGPQVPIIHLHMHENYGDRDSHLPMFTGPAGKDASGIKAFVERMKTRGFSGCIIFEQWPEPPGLLNEARNRLLAIIGNSERPAVESVKTHMDDFVLEIAKANEQCRSWREKLGWINNLLTDDTFDIDIEKLTYLAIYVRFLGTREIICAENGRHYRPSHHANTAQTILDRLFRITTPDNAFIVRKIYPWLPSFSSRFTSSEPLTRIRDIAHRNDIPQELKREIKNTLQNKLHRCAGPEDLATSEALLNRITAPDANYSHNFIEEFRRFHEELKDFFSAGSLNEQLGAILREGSAQAQIPDSPGPEFQEQGDSHTLELIRRFLEVKQRADAPEQPADTLELLTALRCRLQEKRRKDTDSQAQRYQLADIKLEDYSFVLLSRLINYFDASGSGINWPLALRCLNLSIENLRLSSFDIEECKAIESELETWRQGFEPRDREHLIRIKATIDRCRRITDAYCNKILYLFPERVESLGRALGVAEHKIKIFCEVDIRRHLVFQISKLVSLLLGIIRKFAALPPWNVIVPGKVTGRMIKAECLDDLENHFDETVIALLDRVDGDEDIPQGIAGMIVAHETPILSHLAVRARQGGIVFAVSEDADRLEKLKDFLGKRLILDVSAENVNFEMSLMVADKTEKTRQVEIIVPDVLLSSDNKLLPLDQIRPETAGGKADSARRLEGLSQIKGAGFKTPKGVVIPFGVMEESLHASPALEQEYRALISRINEMPHSRFVTTLERLRDIIKKLEVPEGIVSIVMENFTRDERLIVRSSANCEDLEDLAGAGLYDSIADVAPQEVAQAVSRVWSSLWTGRAAKSRKGIGIPHDRAHMAVLIQQMLVPEFSFIIHTVNPITSHQNEVYVELAQGLGETLASAKVPGVPYRMTCNKHTGEVRMLAFASFSHAIMPCPSGGLMDMTVDYSRTKLSTDQAFRTRLGARLGAIGRLVEDSMKGPQDIEGLVIKDRIYLVQSRPQQGVE